MAAAALPLLPTEALAAGNGKRVFKYGSNELDWYTPKHQQANAPILVYVHGGAWALGNRGQVGAKAGYFTDRGFHFVSVGYTLFPAANAQTQTLQVAEAVNWVHHNAGKLSGDPDRIALMGHSAGCHLSSLATLTGGAPAVKALICNDTRSYDLPYLASINGGRLPILYKAPFTRRKMWAAWSPISYTGLQDQPPTLVAWSNGSGRDRVSKRFANALEKDGVDVTRFDGSRRYNHVSIDRRMGRRRDELTKEALNFLYKTLAV